MFSQLDEQRIVDTVLSENVQNSDTQTLQNVEKADIPEQQPQKKEDHPNFKSLRERAEQAERRAQELERYLQNIQPQQQPQQAQQEEQDSFSFEDDTYVEGKLLKKELKTIKKELRETKKQLQEFNQQTTSSSAELRLKARYADFDSIVSQENIHRLAQEKPALYRSMLANPDLYEKGETAYEIIKTLLPRERYEEQDRKIEENAHKPRSAATAQVSSSPLASIQDYDRRILTEERKRQLREQVRNAKMYR